MLKGWFIILFVICLYFVIPITTFDSLTLIDEEIEIFVKGEVLSEQFVSLPPHSKVKELLNKIGLTDTADIARLDLNKYLIDGEVITIPKKIETECISINEATEQQLITLKGIGPVTAEKIIAYRILHGPYLYLEDIMNVAGIGQAKYEKIKDTICL